MKWPATSSEMAAEGWLYDNDAVCKGCMMNIEWWISPKGAKTPINTIPPENNLVSNLEKRQLHFSSCTAREMFKR